MKMINRKNVDAGQLHHTHVYKMSIKHFKAVLMECHKTISAQKKENKF